MELNKKLKIAKETYKNIGLDSVNLKYLRDDEISAHYIWVDKVRGPFGIIIDDKGEMLSCPSIKPYQFYKEEFKKGRRNKNI